MYTQHSEVKGGQIVPIEGGPTVALSAQTQDHQAIYSNAAGEEFSLPASLFFQLHREATAAEMEAAAKAAEKARKPLKTTEKAD